jgi:hypothetical protein
MRARRIIRVQPPAPLGEVTVAPAALTGRAEADMARAMTAVLADVEAPNAAGLSNHGRQAFPLAPPGAGTTALGMMMERVRRFG